MQLALLIGLIVVAVIGFLFTTYIFLRFIVPALGRLKNRVLVEEKDDPKEQSIPVPPSSERN
jgi:Na+-transporting methylmalonyl-CoA/oxaloacetate decarboxylase gamma subunit